MYERGDFTGASRLAGQTATQLQSAKSPGAVQKLAQAYLLYYLSNVYGHAEYQLGRFELLGLTLPIYAERIRTEYHAERSGRA